MGVNRVGSGSAGSIARAALGCTLRDSGFSWLRGNVGDLGAASVDAARLNFLGKVGDNIKVGTPVPVNHLQHGVQLQDFHGRPNQVDFQVGLREKSTMLVESRSGGASLDPTEEKFLFGNDEDSNWGALLRGGNDHGSSMDNDNFGGALPSLQSGSWSALMQEALQSTTSDNSPKEEWSGLSFQKPEQIIANNSTLQDNNAAADMPNSSPDNIATVQQQLNQSPLQGQQYPVSEARSGSVAMPQQGSSATVFKNVWTNISAQRLADDQGQRASTPSDVATSSANSQNQETKQGGDSDAGLASSEMQGIMNKQGENPAVNFQAMKTSQNTDPANIAGKKLKSPETGSDASQLDWKSGQRFAHGANNSKSKHAFSVPFKRTFLSGYGSCSTN
ncbi:hypothetical protein E2562_004833 [Oryza meyeriana var. granulata]|uniref:Uncharacterized protein n=1 Tax=Oryza meyeriana var. granulata TaxID=110450 RepID=A0A6G1DDJ0_9ORYZ|nr:hypothetical protein E2562_004833 [Oryza meyeriana var. granulata]